ncbi:hypothetical protein [Proteus sp. TJ1640]|uniref:hypothetical protein n=1 Tax=Proteus sp. TJ1640 TaxID=2050968 RepID=UPI000D687200|nr:hypothetical protein [Proteus sp. TJ1640]
MFNLTMLSNIYNLAINGNSKTIAFTTNIGVGVFTCMLFLSTEDAERNDKIFIYLGRMGRFFELKMYGAHGKGDFILYIKDWQEQLIRDELGIKNGQRYPFRLNDFLDTLNNQIPQQIDNVRTANTLRDNKDTIKTYLPNIVDEALKVNLVGIRRLKENAKARDKTLRKLYLHSDGNGDDISAFIDAIKSDGRFTIGWREDGDRIPFRELLSQFNDRVQEARIN